MFSLNHPAFLSSASSILSDHSCAVMTAKTVECEERLEQREVIKSLVKKINKLTTQVRKHTFGTKHSKSSYKKLSTDKK